MLSARNSEMDAVIHLLNLLVRAFKAPISDTRFRNAFSGTYASVDVGGVEDEKGWKRAKTTIGKGPTKKEGRKGGKGNREGEWHPPRSSPSPSPSSRWTILRLFFSWTFFLPFLPFIHGRFTLESWAVAVISRVFCATRAIFYRSAVDVSPRIVEM